MKLHLGFESFPYAARYSAQSPLPASTKKKRQKVLSRSQQAYGEGKNTAEVAAELEAKYGVVEAFFNMHEDEIVEMLEEAFADNIEEVLAMTPLTDQPGTISSQETDAIERMFRQDLTNKRFDGIIPGVPTTAALRGVSHLRQHPYAKRAARPSFIDTGLYMRSFRAWVEEEDEE